MKFGYGHEEWMFSLLMREGENQYSFIQAFRNSGYDDPGSKNSLLGKKIDLQLITCNPNNSQWYFIGEIRNLEVLSLKEQEMRLKNAIENGTIDKFIVDVQTIGANSSNLVALKNQSEFNFPITNVKFDLKDAFIQKDYIPLKSKEIKYKHDSTLYNFDLSISTLFEHDNANEVHELIQVFKKDFDRSDEHRKMQLEIFQILDKDDRFLEIQKEFKCKGRLFDLWLLHKNQRNYILEIKPYDSAYECIREALGQVLEYSYFLNRDSNNQLIIIGKNQMNEEEFRYLNHLREKTSLNIHYVYYQLGKRIIDMPD
jgi:hypothetical protein